MKPIDRLYAELWLLIILIGLIVVGLIWLIYRIL